MADLIRKTQFEKICPFPILNAIMQELKELQSKYAYATVGEVKNRLDDAVYRYEDHRNVHADECRIAIEIAALGILIARKETRDNPLNCNP